MKELKICKLYKINKSPNLIVGEVYQKFNFVFKRFFFITGKKNELRGGHAHKKQLQFMVCLKGACKLDFYDGKKKKTYCLNNNQKGIIVSPGIWSNQKYLKKNTILLVLCDKPYDEQDYIRSYDEFLKFKKKKK